MSSENVPSDVPQDSKSVRKRLEEALRLDLVGPWRDHAYVTENLPGFIRPSNWYLTGFLIPSGTPPERASDEDEDDDLDEVPAAQGDIGESGEERKAAKKSFFPSSMGLSFLVPAAATGVRVTVSWGDYVLGEVEDDGKTAQAWQREPHEEVVAVPLAGRPEPVIFDVPASGGLQLHLLERPITGQLVQERIPNGTRSVSVFLVNHREPNVDHPDAAYIFQAGLEVHGEFSFVPRPDLRGAVAVEWDELVADLHYADTPEYATGHGVSADWEVVEGACRHVCTAWIPRAEVEVTKTVDVPQVELTMDTLGALADGAAAEAALRPLVAEYRGWIAAQQVRVATLTGSRRDTAEELLRLAGIAANRIEAGISTLAADADALDAFRMANRSVGRALKKRLGVDAPKWRAFQLAFILLNLTGLADPRDPNRNTVDLLFFPTGGGKTEAYLGLAAFTMVLRRLRHPGEGGLAGAGVSVMMRYTLRLLTLDQLGRAAGLVCALELERETDPERYGTWPFEIGLWVGKAATPNTLGFKGDKRTNTARSKVRAFKREPGRHPSPIPLESCPWCSHKFGVNSFALLPDDDRPRELRVVCENFECDFTRNRPLPIIAVDEPLYRRLPAFLIATVDKFASLPWVGESGALLGGADRHDATGFYGASEPNRGARLAEALPPPDLVIQDELHLISGPLGTMAGLYETAIEALCVRQIGGHTIRPKIVASTATVRRAQDQIQALFARGSTQIFPPPGPDRHDSFFAHTIPGRLYLGVASQGRNPKVMMRKVWLALMASAERAYREAGGHKNTANPADPYMTVLGYFNSLRELGGGRRLLEEEVQNTVKEYGLRRRLGEKSGLFRDRKKTSEVLELTSRVPTDRVAEARDRLGLGFHESKRVDFAIATNMISVGLDIQRLGLMVVLGQPKTHAEYIQATSRVGRDDQRPGLVVTLLNIHKPRDRSHYERFRHYHETFYRSVEVSSVTPFSARAMDRGFAGAMVGLARHAMREMSPPQGVERIADLRVALERTILETFIERVRQQPFSDQQELNDRLRSVQNRIGDLLDSWRKIYEDYNNVATPMQYQQYEQPQGKPLLRNMLDEDFETPHHRKFRANRSLRDVEPAVNLRLSNLGGGTVAEDE